MRVYVEVSYIFFSHDYIAKKPITLISSIKGANNTKEREVSMDNEKNKQILEAARLAYAKGLAHGLNLLAQESDAPEDIKDDFKALEISIINREMVEHFRSEERDGLNDYLYEALHIQTIGGRLPVKMRDEISLTGAKDLQVEARLWELGRYLANSTEQAAYFEYMNNEPFWYDLNMSEDKEFAAILVYAEKYGLDDGERWY